MNGCIAISVDGQVLWALKSQIALGKWQAGEAIPSILDLAKCYRINPKVLQKALTVLEKESLIVSRRMAGCFFAKGATGVLGNSVILGGVSVKFNQSIPIYLQLIRDLKLQIVSGQLATGEKIASVRELAMQYEVNPNTMQKALSELERDQLLFTQRTAGRFVTEDKALIGQLRQDLAKAQVDELVQNMLSMGYSQEEITQLIAGYLEEMN